jgi:AAA domain
MTSNTLNVNQIQRNDSKIPNGATYITAQQAVDVYNEGFDLPPGWEIATEKPQITEASEPDPIVIEGSQFANEYVALDFLVDNIIEEGRLYALTAPTGTGKTAVALSIAEAVAMGVSYAGNVTKQSQVLFLAGENPEDVRVRLMALYERNPQLKASGNIHFIAGTFNIASKMDWMVNYLKDHPKIRIVFVDTAQAFYTGKESNNNTEQVAFAKGFRKINALGVAVVIMAHPVKNPTKDRNEPYGGGGFANEIDGNIALWKDDSGAVEFYWCKKFRGSFESFKLRLDVVESSTAKNTKGDSRSTVLASVISDDEVNAMNKKTTEDDSATFSLVKNNSQLKANDIAKEMQWNRSDKRPDPARAQRSLDRLVKYNYLTLDSLGYITTHSGTSRYKTIF